MLHRVSLSCLNHKRSQTDTPNGRAPTLPACIQSHQVYGVHPGVDTPGRPTNAQEPCSRRVSLSLDLFGPHILLFHPSLTPYWLSHGNHGRPTCRLQTLPAMKTRVSHPQHSQMQRCIERSGTVHERKPPPPNRRLVLQVVVRPGRRADDASWPSPVHTHPRTAHAACGISFSQSPSCPSHDRGVRHGLSRTCTSAPPRSVKTERQWGRLPRQCCWERPRRGVGRDWKVYKGQEVRDPERPPGGDRGPPLTRCRLQAAGLAGLWPRRLTRPTDQPSRPPVRG